MGVSATDADTSNNTWMSIPLKTLARGVIQLASVNVLLSCFICTSGATGEECTMLVAALKSTAWWTFIVGLVKPPFFSRSLTHLLGRKLADTAVTSRVLVTINVGLVAKN